MMRPAKKQRPLAEEAADLRKPQKHDYQWFRRVDRLLDRIIREGRKS